MLGLLRHRRFDDRGAEAVEFAVIVPMLLALLTGLITFGFALNAQVTITQAARAGARYAAICNQDTTCLSNVPAATKKAAYGLTVGSIDVTSCPKPTTPPDLTASATVDVTYVVKIGIPPFAAGLTLHGRASTPCGG